MLWRDMMTLSNGNISALLAICAGNHRSPVNSPRKCQWRGALMFSLICALNKRLSKQCRGWWFETPSCPLWRHCNELHHKKMTFSKRFLRFCFSMTSWHMFTVTTKCLKQISPSNSQNWTGNFNCAYSLTSRSWKEVMNAYNLWMQFKL